MVAYQWRGPRGTANVCVANTVSGTQSHLVVLQNVDDKSEGMHAEAIGRSARHSFSFFWHYSNNNGSSRKTATHEHDADVLHIVGIQRGRLRKVASSCISLVDLVASRTHTEPLYLQAFVGSRFSADQIRAVLTILEDCGGGEGPNNNATKYLFVASVQSTLAPDYDLMRACAALELQRHVGHIVARMESELGKPVAKVFVGDFGCQPSSLAYSYLTALSVSSHTVHPLKLSGLRGRLAGAPVEAKNGSRWQEVRYEAHWLAAVEFPGELRGLRCIGLQCADSLPQREALVSYFQGLAEAQRSGIILDSSDELAQPSLLEEYVPRAQRPEPLACHLVSFQCFLHADLSYTEEAIWTVPSVMTLTAGVGQGGGWVARCPAKPGLRWNDVTRSGFLQWSEWHRCPSSPLEVPNPVEATLAVVPDLLASFFVIEVSYGVGEALSSATATATSTMDR